MTKQRHWRPSADLATVKLRARLLAETRSFFAARGVTEVETPTLSVAANPDPHVESLQTRLAVSPHRPMFLHTSPELPMKRLVAAGFGDIFQICRVYRDGELGRTHQPEFTLLEWYRVGMSAAELRAELLVLLARLLGPDRVNPAETVSYREVFKRYLGLDPFDAPDAAVRDALAARGHQPPDPSLRGSDLLDLAFSLAIAPGLGCSQATLIIDYPADQAALAALNAAGLAQRFELFLDGLELANGFKELTDAAEQRRRFAAERDRRAARGQYPGALDEAFLAALDAGLPACAGVAVGFDRLVMLAAGLDHIDAVLTFPHGPQADAP